MRNSGAEEPGGLLARQSPLAEAGLFPRSGAPPAAVSYFVSGAPRFRRLNNSLRRGAEIRRDTASPRRRPHRGNTPRTSASYGRKRSTGLRSRLPMWILTRGPRHESLYTSPTPPAKYRAGGCFTPRHWGARDDSSPSRSQEGPSSCTPGGKNIAPHPAKQVRPTSTSHGVMLGDSAVPVMLIVPNFDQL